MSAMTNLDSSLSGAQCIPNIGPEGRQQRVVVGIVFLVVAALHLGALLFWDLPRYHRLFLFPWVLVSGVGFFQALGKTCIALAARQERSVGQGIEPITNANDNTRIRAQARRVWIQSLSFAFVATALSFALP